MAEIDSKTNIKGERDTKEMERGNVINCVRVRERERKRVEENVAAREVVCVCVRERERDGRERGLTSWDVRT